MRNITRLTALTCAIVLAACGCRSLGPTKVSHRGFEACYRLANATTEVIIAPESGGRILSYALNGNNILFRDPKADGALVKAGKKFHADAGRFDIGPEKHPTHKIPPRPLLWKAEWTAEARGPGCLRLVSQKCPSTGVQITRVFTLAADSSYLHVRQTMANVGDEVTRWCFWSRTLAKAGGICMVPLNPKSKFPKGYARYLWGEDRKKRGKDLLTDDPSEPRIKVVGDLVTLEAVGEKSLKIGCDSDAEWMAYACDGMLFVKRFRYFPDGVYNDALGFSVAVYLNDRMCELEPISPEAALQPGQSYSFDEHWWLLDCPAANERPLDYERIKEAVATKTALPKSD